MQLTHPHPSTILLEQRAYPSAQATAPIPHLPKNTQLTLNAVIYALVPPSRNYGTPQHHIAGLGQLYRSALVQAYRTAG